MKLESRIRSCSKVGDYCLFVKLLPSGKTITGTVESLNMLSSSPLRVLRLAVPRIKGKRFASHEAPQYNEPSGWLFGEKVCLRIRSLSAKF